MPELPEVEVVRKELEALFEGQPRLEKIEFLRKELRDPMPIAKIQLLLGARILAVRRRAKYLLIETEKGGLLSHLGMTGTWRVAVGGDDRLHDHVYLHLSNGLRLAFRDPRRFGILEVFDLRFPEKSPRLCNLGPEPLEEIFTGIYLWRQLKLRKGPVKPALMDQKLVVGIGNIYASEALFRAKIRPQRKSNRVSLESAEILVGQIKQILAEAILSGGSSISDFKGAQDNPGSFHLLHQVYDRKGVPCVICGTLIRQSVMAGRSTFWCPVCQS